MAMPKAVINWEVFDAMLQFGPTKRFMAEHFSINERTIERHIKDLHDMTFSEYKDFRMDKTRLKLQQTAINMAFGKDRTLLIFCLKNLCNWTDNNKIDQTTTNREIKIDVFSNENPFRKNSKADPTS